MCETLWVRCNGEAPEDSGPFEVFDDLRKTPFRPRKRKQGHAVEVELNPVLHYSTTIPLRSLESCLHVFNQTAKKLHPATLDEATAYVKTRRFLPPPWNDVTHGVPRGSPPLHSGEQNQKWPTCGQGGYVTLAASGIPNASERGAKSEVAHLWATWLRNPCRLEDPNRFRAGGKIRSGPLVGKVAT